MNQESKPFDQFINDLGSKGTDYDRRHGGPFDRGGADSYYRRPPQPHYYVGGTGTSDRVTDLTPEEVQAYHAGYEENEANFDFKIWD
jgi:hypothetical protein